MFKNPGKKLKVLANIFAFLIIAGAVIAAVVIAIPLYDRNPLYAVLYILGGVLGGLLTAFLTCLTMYAFGQLVDDTQKIREAAQQR